jgi:uncharacterized membrane protein YgdD (TMEM256/DUF423 family)
MDRNWLAVASLSMFIAIAAGAFGRHALKERLSPDRLETFETAVRYQAYHGLALLAVSVAAARFGGTAIWFAGIAFTVGTILFSGSLYALALTGARWLGAITPIGGLLLLAGWLALLWSALVSRAFASNAP